MLAMYLKKVSCEEFSWGGCIPYVVTMELIYIGRNQEGMGNLWPLFDDRISDYVWLLSGNRCDEKKCGENEGRQSGELEEQILILAGSMAVFLAVFDNQYAKEKQEMLDTTFYKQVIDSKITDAIQTATDEAKKRWRILPDSPAGH